MNTHVLVIVVFRVFLRVGVNINGQAMLQTFLLETGTNIELSFHLAIRARLKL